MPLTAGDKILCYAAAGGVGTILCQWAKHHGAFVIGTVSAADKEKPALANGCDAVINYRTDDFVARTMELTGGKGVRACFDSVARDTFEKSKKVLAPFGTVALFGHASGDVDPPSYSRIPLDRNYIHPTIDQYFADPAERQAGADALFGAIRAGIIRTGRIQTWPLKDAARAQEALETRNTIGSTVFLT